MADSEEIYMKYIGNGNTVPNVPATDLTHAQWLAIPKEDREFAIKAGTHERTKSEAAHAKHAVSKDSKE